MLTLVARDDWGAAPPTLTPKQADLSKLWSVSHHFVGPKPAENALNEQFGRGVQRWHQNHMGWSDIAYGFLLCRDGVVLVARGINWVNFAEGGSTKADLPDLRNNGRHLNFVYGKDHAKTWNQHTVSVLWQNGRTVGVSGTYQDGEDETPTAAQIQGAADLHTYIDSQTPNRLFVDVHGGHRTKTCPGGEISKIVDSGMIGPVAPNTRFTHAHEHNPAPLPATPDVITPTPAPAPAPVPVSAGTVNEFDEAIALGITDGTNPEEPCKRRHAAVMAYRAFKAARRL